MEVVILDSWKGKSLADLMLAISDTLDPAETHAQYGEYIIALDDIKRTYPPTLAGLVGQVMGRHDLTSEAETLYVEENP